MLHHWAACSNRRKKEPPRDRILPFIEAAQRGAPAGKHTTVPLRTQPRHEHLESAVHTVNRRVALFD
jgi:hypothetical protein